MLVMAGGSGDDSEDGSDDNDYEQSVTSYTIRRWSLLEKRCLPVWRKDQKLHGIPSIPDRTEGCCTPPSATC